MVHKKFLVLTQHESDYNPRFSMRSIDNFVVLIEQNCALSPYAQSLETNAILGLKDLLNEDGSISWPYNKKGIITINEKDIPRYIKETIAAELAHWKLENYSGTPNAVILHQNGSLAFYDKNGEVTSMRWWYDDGAQHIDYSNSPKND